MRQKFTFENDTWFILAMVMVGPAINVISVMS